MLPNRCDHKSFLWLHANPNTNDQYKNIHCRFSRNVNFRLNTVLHGALHFIIVYSIELSFLARIDICQTIIYKHVDYLAHVYATYWQR